MQTVRRLSAKAYSYAAMLKAFLIDKSDGAVHPKIFVGAEYIRSDTDDGLYIRAVENANHNFEAFLNFKRNEDYRVVLELMGPMSDFGPRTLYAIDGGKSARLISVYS